MCKKNHMTSFKFVIVILFLSCSLSSMFAQTITGSNLRIDDSNNFFNVTLSLQSAPSKQVVALESTPMNAAHTATRSTCMLSVPISTGTISGPIPCMFNIDLQPTRTYDFYFNLVFSDGTRGPSQNVPSVCTPTGACKAKPAPPTNIKLLGSTKESLHIKWDPFIVLEGSTDVVYFLYYAIGTITTSGHSNAGAETEKTITGLQSNTVYSIGVTSGVDAATSKSIMSQIAYFKTNISDPPSAAPTNVRFSYDAIDSASFYSLIVTWNTVPSGFDGGSPINNHILIFNYTDPSTQQTTINNQITTGSGVGVYRLNETRTGTYSFIVIAINKDGFSSPPSTTYSITITDPPKFSGSNLRIDDSNNAVTATLSLESAPSKQVIAFEATARSPSHTPARSTFYLPVSISAGTIPEPISCTFNIDLQPTVTYDFYFNLLFSDGTRGTSQLISSLCTPTSVCKAKPAPPTNIKLLGSTKESLHIKWDPFIVLEGSNDVVYFVYYAIGPVTTSSPSIAVAESEKVITMLQSNTIYSIGVVSAVDAATSKSIMSQIAYFKTNISDPPSAAPTNVRFNFNRTPNTNFFNLVLTWNTVPSSFDGGSAINNHILSFNYTNPSTQETTFNIEVSTGSAVGVYRFNETIAGNYSFIVIAINRDGLLSPPSIPYLVTISDDTPQDYSSSSQLSILFSLFLLVIVILF